MSHALTGKYTWPNPTTTDPSNNEVLTITVDPDVDPKTGLHNVTGQWDNHVMTNNLAGKRFVMERMNVVGTVMPRMWKYTNEDRYLIQLSAAGQAMDPDGEGLGVPAMRATQATIMAYASDPLPLVVKLTSVVAEAQDIPGHGEDTPVQKPAVWTK